ncbi:CG8550 [Drosophila busckii]|uniref:CG8550 n=2 Tax=Drosophila busckii TaxID=30019 RepID=A0A0M5J4G7_DROBS|nr:CG8550 [Drosophila busckii]
MRDYFKACGKQQSQELKELKQQQLQLWAWLGKLRQYGLNGVFFEQTVDVAYNDSKRYVLQLKMPASADLEQLAVDAELQQFVWQLRDLTASYDSEESTIQSWSFDELQQQIPQINWQMYFEALLTFDLSAVRVEVSDVAYLRAVGQLLQRSQPSNIAAYVQLQLAKFMQQARPKRGSNYDCIQHMRALLPLGMNYIYNRYVYKTRATDMQQLQALFATLKQVFAKYLTANRLSLNQQQLAYLRNKLQHMQLQLGNLPPNATSSYYNAHYGSISFANDFEHNLLAALQLRTRLQHAPLMQPHAQLQLDTYYVNDDLFVARNAPYFEPERNTLTVPLIFMQLPFYHQSQHPVFRHSLMGFILAHELNHAFEHEGILYDYAGNESPLGASIRQQPAYQLALKCVVQESTTAALKERLADVNGLQLAYDAFFGLNHDSSQFAYLPYAFEQRLLAPQLFHLNFAQFFCGRLPIALGHDMDNVRVYIAQKYLHQFAIDFKCAPTSATNCSLWRA